MFSTNASNLVGNYNINNQTRLKILICIIKIEYSSYVCVWSLHVG